MPTDLFLIRHGESVANVEPIIGGMNGDAGFTERGRRQAALLEERLRNHGCAPTGSTPAPCRGLWRRPSMSLEH